MCDLLQSFFKLVTDDGIPLIKYDFTFFFFVILVEEWDLWKIWSVNLDSQAFELFGIDQSFNKASVVGVLSDRTDKDKDFEFVTGGAAHFKSNLKNILSTRTINLIKISDQTLVIL